MTPSNTLQISVNGELWWGGFTAEIAVRNASDQPLESWSTSFVSAHDLDPEAWGVEITREPIGDGLSRYTLRGTSWGQSIPAGGEIRVGFNGRQGVDLGRDGALSEAMLMTERPLGESVMTDADAHNHAGEHTAERPAEQASPSHGHSTMTGSYTDITTWGSFHGANHNSEHNELVGGRTAITTEAMEAYNGLRAFAGLQAVGIEAVGEWAYAQGLTNNTQAWGDDTKGVGLWYAMQAAKVGWIADETYNPQILADIQRTARQGDTDAVMAMVERFGHEGFASYLRSNALVDTFTNTLKMEPHYGGWMHGRTHGFLSIEGVAINHDINHLTVLGWDQNQPFMNDTFDYPQWPALEVSDDTVINYFQSIVSLGNPLEGNLNQLQTTQTPETNEYPWSEFNRIKPNATKTSHFRFNGTAQQDALISTSQKDFMAGRDGADLFAFTATEGPTDIVTDFNPADGDRIGIDAETFPGIDTIDLAIANNKTEYRQLKRSDANLIYQANKGKLLYNKNGSDKGLGSDNPVLAKFKGNPLINNQDVILFEISDITNPPQSPPSTSNGNSYAYTEALESSLLF